MLKLREFVCVCLHQCANIKQSHTRHNELAIWEFRFEHKPSAIIRVSAIISQMIIIFISIGTVDDFRSVVHANFLMNMMI